MRFHILGIPHTVTSKEYSSCAFTQKVLKFGAMMTPRGHEVIHYGHEDSSVICSQHVTVVTNEDLKKAYGDHDWRKNFFKYDMNDHAYKTFFKNTIREISKRKQKNDFILAFWGNGHKPVCDAHDDLFIVEPGIGYSAPTFAPYRVFESYAMLHATLGINAVAGPVNAWYDVVIPNYFDVKDFTYNENKEDYFLFIGRVCESKGVHIAEQVTREVGCKLIVAGTKVENISFGSHVEYVGHADFEKRRLLMANAKGGFVATTYVEPFGGVQIELLMSGTPTITTDWGAFTENNLHGITGYRCRTYDQFAWAAININKIKSSNCRAWAENFTFDRIAPMYEEYFQTIQDLKTNKGWYQRHLYRNDINWLNKNYPIIQNKGPDL